MKSPTDLSELDLLRRVNAMLTEKMERIEAELKAASAAPAKRVRGKRAAKGRDACFQIKTGKQKGRWVSEHTFPREPGAKRVRVRVYGDTQQDALAALDEKKKAGAPVPRSQRTVADLVNLYVDAKRTNWSPTTLAARESAVKNHVLPRFGEVVARKLTSTEVMKNWTAMLADGVSSINVRRTLETLASAFRFGLEQVPPLVQVNPVPAAKKWPAVDIAERHVPTEAEFDRFMDAAEGDPLFAMYSLVANSGMRFGEALGVTWGDWDRFRRTITIRRSIAEARGKIHAKQPKTKKSARTIDVSPATAEVIERHRKAAEERGHATDTHPMFADDRGGWLRKGPIYRKSFHPILARAGVRFVIHALRHRAGMRLVNQGVPIHAVARRLGHSKPTLTMNLYANHETVGEGAGAAVLLDRPGPVPAAAGNG